MRQPLITLGLLGVLAWLLWERHQSAESVDDEITHLRRALEDSEAELDACEGTLARSEAALTRQRADHAAREHALEQTHLRALERLQLEVAQAQVECLIGRADAELQPGDARAELQAALTRLRDEILASRTRLEEAEAQVAAGEQERARLQAELEQAGAARVELERRLTRTVEARDQYHWYAFRAQTVLGVCEEEGRDADTCARELTDTLDEQAERWLACVKSSATNPVVLTLPRDQAPPQPAEPLYRRRREVVWLQLCDPTLPEAR